MNDFVLYNKTAKKLYKEVADLPIIDYHCHLSAEEIRDNAPYKNITQMWLYGDHYKWRLMRTNGVDEKFVTGDADDYAKFEHYMQTLCYAIGSPLYHWSKMELKKYFDVDCDLIPENIEYIYKQANKAIADKHLTPQSVIEMSNVEAVCTIEEVFSDLNAHRALKDSSISTKILPAIRGDKIVNIFDDNFPTYVKKLEKVTGVKIVGIASLKEAIDTQMDAFTKCGCVSGDFAYEGFNYVDTDEQEVEGILRDALNGKVRDVDKYVTFVLRYMLSACYKRNFVAQVHIGAMRNNNDAQRKVLGADCGYDSVSDKAYIWGLKQLFNSIPNLGKTILFNLNPADNAIISTFVGCFVDGTCRGKMQMGAAWWFNDTYDGMVEQLKSTCNLSYLNTFVGMLTDSRSIISYPRHDYFRRILCSFVGEKVEKGEFTSNEQVLNTICSNVSYYNAKKFFNL